MKEHARATSRNSDLADVINPIVQVELTEEIVHRIKSLLQDGTIKPGSKLPPERELAAMLGISRPSLRQGLKALRMMAVIDSKRRHGTFVSEFAAKVLHHPLDFVRLLHAITFEDLFEARKVIEVELAAWAAQRGKNAEMQEIHSCLMRQHANLDAPEEFLKEDFEFHHLIAKASHNVLFILFLESLGRLMIENRRALLRTEGDLCKSYRDHLAVWQKLKARDADGARQAMRRHLDRIYNVWKQSFEDKTASQLRSHPERER